MKYEKICNLQELNGLSIGKNYLSNNACKRFIASIAADIKDETKSDFNSARFITIMSDGSTDKGHYYYFVFFFQFKNSIHKTLGHRLVLAPFSIFLCQRICV